MYPSMYNGPGAGGPLASTSGEMCQISVPNSVVGAIIGAGGSIIKQIMQDSNAHVMVSTTTTAKNMTSKNGEEIS